MSVDTTDLRELGSEITSQVISGVEAVPRLLVEQHKRDRTRGIRTASFISGYPGSPLAGLDLTIAQFPDKLVEDIYFTPAVNEELAATAVWGSQVALPGHQRNYDGVVGAWYGKSPGIDRAGDAIRHANFVGADPRGGVLLLVGDDPSAKSSSIPNASEKTLAGLSLPVLYPKDSAELITLGMFGIEVSRATGLWVAMKIVNDVADGVSVVEDGQIAQQSEIPELTWKEKPWIYRQYGGISIKYLKEAEFDLYGPRWQALEEIVAANEWVNPTRVNSRDARFGIVAAGKTFSDVREALSCLGLSDHDLRRAGCRLLQVGSLYPLPSGPIRTFAKGLQRILVVEEKASFLESQIRDALYGGIDRPLILGKRDEAGRALVPPDGELSVSRLLDPMRRALDGWVPMAEAKTPRSRIDLPILLDRGASWCSGCPHSRSTRLPEGALVGAGIGCHGTLAASPDFKDVVAMLTQMGGEGSQWIGQAPFTKVEHIFQNLGDGTYFHSGQLAIQFCIAAGVNITYKILYNSAVANTGGQKAQGAVPVKDLVTKLQAEGVGRIIVCADEPERYHRKKIGRDVVVWHRDRLMEAQGVLRQTPGVTVLIYDQQCAAEARRLRRSGRQESRTQRVVINEEICEGCGDCGEKSLCLSVEPMDTQLGRKTRINQTSCNTDYSCLDGDCPSFVTVKVKTDGKQARSKAPDAPDATEPKLPSIDGIFNVLFVGLGGTGVVTVNRILAKAAEFDGLYAQGIDQKGGAQKGGAVRSHLRISRVPLEQSNQVPPASADRLVAFDCLAGASDASLDFVSSSRTKAIVSTDLAPTLAMVRESSASAPQVDDLVARIRAAVAEVATLDTKSRCEQLFGTTDPVNIYLFGASYQAGAFPVTSESIERAIAYNGVAVEVNLAAFRWGRRAFIDGTIDESAESTDPSVEIQRVHQFMAETSLEGEALRLAQVRTSALIAWGGRAVAKDYLRVLEGAWVSERLVTERTEFSEAVARGLHRVIAYKDEYEVARLMFSPRFMAELKDQYPDARRVRQQLHPPVLRALGMKSKISISSRWRPAFKLLAAGRVVRDTPFDLFGYTKVRRMERHLRDQYTEMIQSLTSTLSSENYELAVVAANAVEVVKGYEGIKERNYERYRQHLSDLGVVSIKGGFTGVG